MATKSEVAAQILPSLGARENTEKKLSILSINTWVTGSPSPFKRGTKIFRRLQCHPISPFWLVQGRDLSNILAPRKGGGWGGVGGGGGCWGQGLHLGAPHGQNGGWHPHTPSPGHDTCRHKQVGHPTPLPLRCPRQRATLPLHGRRNMAKVTVPPTPGNVTMWTNPTQTQGLLLSCQAGAYSKRSQWGPFRTAPIITLFIPGTPLKTTHLQKDA